MKAGMSCLVAFLLWMTFSPGCAGPQTGEAGARRALDDVAEAMGGWEALRGVRAQHIVSEGSDWEPMQAVKPGETRQVNSFSATLTIDFERKAVRVAFSAQRTYPTPQAVVFTEVIEGESGALEQTDASGMVSVTRLHPSRYATRLRDLRRMAARVVFTASEAEGLNRLDDQTIDRVSYQILRYKDAGQTVELHINSSKHLPARIVYMEDDPIFGDTRNEWMWSDWKTVAGVQLPSTQEHRLNGLTIRKETIKEIQNNPSVPATAFFISDEVRQEPEVGDRVVSQWPLRRAVMGVGFQEFARPQKVELEQVAPGVFHARGGTHHTMIVEMKDHVMIIEAPLFEDRSLAVIKAVKEKIPGKPIRHAIVTHFHIDHSGGIRTYAAEGASVIGHSSIIPFLENVLTRPRTIKLDSLVLTEARTGKPPQIALDGVATMKEYTDGNRVVQVYAIPNLHAQGMLVAYLPKERIIFNSDLVTPGTPIDPTNANARAFHAVVKELGLKVDRIVAGHGTVGSFRDLATVMEKTQ